MGREGPSVQIGAGLASLIGQWLRLSPRRVRDRTEAAMTRTETIVAAATPPGRGGVGIVRLSGPKVPEFAAVVLGEVPLPRRAVFAPFLDARQ